MKIIYRKTADLKPYKNNPRINDEAVEATKESIILHGFVNPLIIDRDNVIIAGHTRLKAAQELDLPELPCIVMDEEDPDLVRQYRIVDNKTAEKSAWNIPKLIEELSGIQEMDLSAFRFGEVRSEKGEPVGEGQITKTLLERANAKDRKLEHTLKRLTGEKGKYYSYMLIQDPQVAPTVTSGGMYFRLYDKLQLSDDDFRNVQTFPQDYNFKKQSAQYVCGMSVPPNMMANIATEVYEQWLR